MTRGEFARWLIETHNKLYEDKPEQQIRSISEVQNIAFQDLSKSDRNFTYIQTLAETGIIPSRLTGNESDLLMLKNAGTGIIRMDVLWGMAEKTPG